MTKYTTIEGRLLQASDAGDLPTIIDIVSHLSIKEKESIATNVFDAVLYSISNYAKKDPTESAYTTMMFIRAVGCYTSAAAVNVMLQSTAPIPYAAQRERADNVHHLRIQNAT